MEYGKSGVTVAVAATAWSPSRLPFSPFLGVGGDGVGLGGAAPYFMKVLLVLTFLEKRILLLSLPARNPTREKERRKTFRFRNALWSRIEKKHRKNSYLIIHCPTCSGERARRAVRSIQSSDPCEQTSVSPNGRASGSVLTAGFMAVLDHSAAAVGAVAAVVGAAGAAGVVAAVGGAAAAVVGAAMAGVGAKVIPAPARR